MPKGVITLRMPVRDLPTHVRVRAVDGLCGVGEGFFDSITSMFTPTTTVVDGKTVEKPSGLTSLLNTGLSIFGTYQGLQAQKEAAQSAEDLQMMQLLQAQQQTQAVRDAAAAQAKLAAAQAQARATAPADNSKTILFAGVGGLALLGIMFFALRK